jgi:hypothetical protein
MNSGELAHGAVDNLTPGPDDYFVECTVVVGEGTEPLWTIGRHGEMLHAFPTQDLTLRVVRELARIDRCRAWLLVSGAAPVILTS